MKRSFRCMRMSAAGVLCSILAVGCAGPSTRVLPRENHWEYLEQMEESSFLESANPFYIQEMLGFLTESSRAGGSQGETKTGRMLQQYLQDYGYEVTRQRFRQWNGKDVNEATGTNVVAVRKAHSENADILIVSTHHDTAPGSPGANDNASGTAVWLETARLVSRLPSDTEIRFVSFSGTENGWLGSRYYVESLSEKEKNRVIGTIQLDACAGADFPQLVLGTEDGKETMLGNQLQQSFWDVLGETLSYEMRSDSDAVSFVRGMIPAVSLTQKRDSYTKDTPLDQEDTVDVEQIARITDCVADAVAQIMSVDSPSMRAKSRFMNDLRDNAYIQRNDSLLGFGMTRRSLQGKFRQEGVLISSHESEEHTIEDFQYPMKWFDVDQIILSNYYFVNGRLDSIMLDADGAGIDLDDMTERICSWYGEADQEGSGPNGVEYIWHVPQINLSVTLTQNTDGYDVELKRYSSETRILGQFDAEGTLVSLADGQEVRLQKVFHKWNLMIPQEIKEKISAVMFYTDGLEETTGYLVPERDETGLRSVEIFMDLDDLMDAKSGWRNETEAEKRMLYLLGELLKLENPDDTAIRFYERFAEDANSVQAGVSPGELGNAETTLPDFSESFLYFVLTERQDERPDAWSERIGFFYGNPEFVSWRSEIRKNLNLSQ